MIVNLSPVRTRRASRWATALVAVTLGCLASVVRADAYEDFNRAVATNDAAALTKLLARGMDPNTVNDRGEAALLAAARDSGPEVVKALVKARAKLNVKSPFGDTPIMLAALRGNLPIVKLLREAGAEINQPGWTPLLYASLNGHNAVVEYLLSTGADVGLAAPNGSTAVMLAVLGKKPDTVKLLASYGFDVNAKNDKGETALALAKREKNEEMEAVLRSLGAR